MTVEFEQALGNYRQARRIEWHTYHQTGTINPALTANRFAAKGTLASVINEAPDSQGAQSLLDKLHSGRRVMGYTLAELALLKEETPATLSPGRREPTIEEAILATEHLGNVEQKVVVQFQGFTQGLIQVGSLSWAKNFWINHPKAQTRPSDIDFEAIVTPRQLSVMTENPLFRGNAEFASGLHRFQYLNSRGQADYFTFRPMYEGVFVSVHLVPEALFQRICEFDFAETMETRTLLEYRTKGRSAGYDYKQRGFDGASKIFRSTPLEDSAEGVIFPVPLAIVDSNGYMGLGYPVDKYLSASRIYLDPNNSIRDSINIMRTSIARRLKAERIKREMPELTLGQAFSRRERMNPETVEIMDAAIEAIIHTPANNVDGI